MTSFRVQVIIAQHVALSTGVLAVVYLGTTTIVVAIRAPGEG